MVIPARPVSFAFAHARQFLTIAALVMACSVWILLTSTDAAHAKTKFAFISVDAHNGKVIESKYADSRRYPASLTKIMTLYVLFEELKKQGLSKFVQKKFK